MAAKIDLRKSCLDCFAELVGEDVKDALVYVDAGAAEAFHFMGGLEALLSFGPRAVCSLENASPEDAAVCMNHDSNGPVQKVVVITTHILSDAHRYILRVLQAHSSVRICRVLTSLSEEAHAEHPDFPLGPDAFHEYRRLLMEDYRDFKQRTHPKSQEKLAHPEEYEVEGEGGVTVPLSLDVVYFPTLICPLSSWSFVFPSKGTIAGAPLADKLDNSFGIGLPCIDNAARWHDDDIIPLGATLLAHFLHNLAGQLSLRFDVFSLGPLSSVVGKRLMKLSGLADVSGRSRKPAGLLIIDRTLDLITPSCHSNNLMDRLFATLSRREDGRDTQKPRTSLGVVNRRPLDIRVPNGGSRPDLLRQELCVLMSNVGSGKLQTTKTKADDSRRDRTFPMLCSVGGSLFDSIKNHMSGRLDLLFEKRVTDALFTIRRWLQEAVRVEKMNPTARSRIGVFTAQEFLLLSQQLSQTLASAVRHADLVQISKAVELALDSGHNSKWDALSSAEKILLMSVGDSSQSLAFQLRDLVLQTISTDHSRNQAHGQKLFSLRDALTLAIVGYALAGDSFGGSVREGPFSPGEEQELKEAITDAILQGPEPNLGFLGGLEESLALHKRLKSSVASMDDEAKPTATADVADRIRWAGESEPTAKLVMESGDQHVEVDFNEGWEVWDDEDDNDMAKSESNGGGYGERQLQLEVRDRVDEVFKRLYRVSEARRYLQVKDKSLMVDDNGGMGGSPHTNRSLIYKVLSLIFARSDVPGMEHHASAVGRFLKSGLGRFGLGQAKPKLSDNKVIMVFVIGGINGAEICEAKEAQAAFKMADGIDLLLGGTTYLTPDDMYDLLFGCGSWS